MICLPCHCEILACIHLLKSMNCSQQQPNQGTGVALTLQSSFFHFFLSFVDNGVHMDYIFWHRRSGTYVKGGT